MRQGCLSWEPYRSSATFTRQWSWTCSRMSPLFPAQACVMACIAHKACSTHSVRTKLTWQNWWTWPSWETFHRVQVARGGRPHHHVDAWQQFWGAPLSCPGWVWFQFTLPMGLGAGHAHRGLLGLEQAELCPGCWGHVPQLWATPQQGLPPMAGLQCESLRAGGPVAHHQWAWCATGPVAFARGRVSSATTMVFQFHGCLFHGHDCRKFYDAWLLTTAQERRERTERDLDYLRATCRYTLWECECEALSMPRRPYWWTVASWACWAVAPLLMKALPSIVWGGCVVSLVKDPRRSQRK